MNNKKLRRLTKKEYNELRCFGRSSFNSTNRKGCDHPYIDFSNLDLSIFSLCQRFAYANLFHCDFSNSNLRNICFRYSDLRECDFTNTNLQGANFTNTNLKGAIFDVGIKIRN